MEMSKLLYATEWDFFANLATKPIEFYCKNKGRVLCYLNFIDKYFLPAFEIFRNLILPTKYVGIGAKIKNIFIETYRWYSNIEMLV